MALKSLGNSSIELELQLNIVIAKIYDLTFEEFMFLYKNEELDIIKSDYDKLSYS